MPTVYIGVGSNIEPLTNVLAAIRLLKERVRVMAVSTFYRTEPVGCPGAPEFVNGVVEVETGIEPRNLKFDVLRAVERKLGRERGPDKNAPRTIDLDILAYGSLAISEPDLVVPDPEITARPFLAVPLAELAPDMASPISPHDMTPLDEFTEALRREVEIEP